MNIGPATLARSLSDQPLLLTKAAPMYSSSHLAPPELSARRRSFHDAVDGSIAEAAPPKARYTYAAVFLVAALVSFVVQTETAVYIQTHLHWNKAYCMLYMTHSSWILLWPIQLLVLRYRKRHLPWPVFWRRHVQLIRSTVYMIKYRTARPNRQSNRWPVNFMFHTVVCLACALTVAGGSWYLAVDLTSSSDLTAIYNCSAFFAYAFSIPLLGEKLRMSKVVSVIIAIIGVFVVAYGSGDSGLDSGKEPKNRLLGNTVIGIGSALYGLYEVLYKRMGCPPDGTSAGRGMIFANTVGSAIGLFTLVFLWVPLPILHWLGWETFVFPTGETAWMCLITIVANVTFSGSFLVLISLTSPVLSSVAALLTIFIVALVDELLPEPYRQPLTKAAIWGGLLIVIAFVLLSWATYRELVEEEEGGKDGAGSDLLGGGGGGGGGYLPIVSPTAGSAGVGGGHARAGLGRGRLGPRRLSTSDDEREEDVEL